MPIGEDIPMLVPIAIILTVLILFLVSIFINMSEQSELIRMSQVSLNIIDYSANIIFTDNHGNLKYSKVNALGTNSLCNDLDELNISSNYNVLLNISDITSNEWWCWKNSKEVGTGVVLTNTVPFAILNENQTDIGKVTISVSK